MAQYETEVLLNDQRQKMSDIRNASEIIMTSNLFI
jgi:hypothetical protein